MKKIDEEKIVEDLLGRSTDKIYPSKEAFRQALLKGRLIVYHGVDPTGPHLHLGHLTNFLLLKQFQDLGHKIILLVGDFTARIGDPTDKTAARKPLTKKEVAINLKTFKIQVQKILSFSGKNPARIVFNSKWHEKLGFSQILELASHFTVQQMLERDMFEKRLKEEKPIGLHEFFYPLMQGYDSVALNVDLEVGGTDQTFNMLMGRDLMKIYRNKNKFVVTTKLLVNPKTGEKLMNKSEGGMINLDDTAPQMFGKIMALTDESMFEVARFSSLMPINEIDELNKGIKDGLNPRDVKLKIAEVVVEGVFGKILASKAREDFLNLFSKKEIPSDAPILKLKNKNISVVDLVFQSGVVKSKSEAWRLIEQGAFSMNGEVYKNPKESLILDGGENLKIGKKSFFRVKI
jgi:tyrosyl-tRNA synthetase